MKITPEDAARIAALARLQLDEDKRELFAHQFESILGYMDTLAELDTTGVEPLYSPTEHSTPWREDVPERHCTRDEILSNAPEDDGQFFIVPKIV